MADTSIEAEEGIFAINRLRGVVPPPVINPWRRWSRTAATKDRLRLELAFPRVVAAGEDYLVKRAARKLAPELLAPIPPPDKPDRIVRRVQKAARGVDALKDLWKTDMRVDLETLQPWLEFDLVRQIRHVLVHRLGQWQPGLDPKPKPKLADRLRNAGLNVLSYRGQIPLSRADFDEAARATTLLIDRVDALL